jgi:hypothetical protein
MSHNGLKVIDSDMHIIEPADLWQRYIDPRFKDGVPAGHKTPFPRDISVNLSYGMPAEHAGAQPHMVNWYRALRNHMKPVEHEYEFATRRNFDAISQVEVRLTNVHGTTRTTIRYGRNVSSSASQSYSTAAVPII